MPNSKNKLGFWIIFPVALGISLASLVSPVLLAFKNINFLETAIESINPANSASETKLKYFYVNKNADIKPKISALSYLVGDLDTGEVILSKNQDQKLPIASISKLMTAFVLGELADLEDAAQINTQISRRAVNTEGKNGNLRAGEKIKISDLVYPLLLESSNDAAEAIAEYFGRDIFIGKMNQQGEKLQMLQTSFEDPSGLSANNQSTASDIFKLSGYINKQKPELLEITTKRSYSNKTHVWSNISRFIGENGYLGGKSGYTSAAMQTVVSIFSVPLGDTDKDMGNRPIAITLLRSTDRHRDVENILEYLKKNIYYGGQADATTDWVKEKVGIPEIKDPDFLSFTFAGDIMLDRGVKNSVIKNFNNDYSKLFENPDLLKLFKKSDIVFANLEGTASDRGEDGGNLYSFQMDPAVVPSISGAGIDILSVANNHVGDWGRLSYIDTLARLKENEILYTGGGNNKTEAETPAIIEKYGIKIGFLGFSDKGPDFMKANADTAGLLSASDPNFDEIIKNASGKVDYLVVSFHFGEEYQDKHNARQEFLAHRAVDDGAKIVIGHHPHVIEDTEVYKNGYIAYSLGNFIFDQAFSEKTMQGMLLNIKLGRDGSITVRKDIVKLNKVFQPDKIMEGKEEKIKFE